MTLLLKRQRMGFSGEVDSEAYGGITVASRTLEERVLGWGISPSRIFYVPNRAVSRGFNVNVEDVIAVRRRLCENARKRILNVFNWDRLTEKVEQTLFDQITKRKKVQEIAAGNLFPRKKGEG